MFVFIVYRPKESTENAFCQDLTFEDFKIWSTFDDVVISDDFEIDWLLKIEPSVNAIPFEKLLAYQTWWKTKHVTLKFINHMHRLDIDH